MTFQEFQANVQGWAEARGIYAHSTALAQALKAVSEVGELADAVVKNDRDGLIDAIGDVAVCLVNVARMEMVEADFRTVLNPRGMDSLVISASCAKCVSDLAFMVGKRSSGYDDGLLGSQKSIKDQTRYSMGHLDLIARECGLDFLACCESAWLEIKDRKGRMVEGGAFVKD